MVFVAAILDRALSGLYATPVKRCVFCKTDLSGPGVTATVEHIVPQWLQREWGLQSHNISPTHSDSRGNVISSRSHGLSAFVAGNVCDGCNNGWMSALEVASKPLILDLAGGRRRVIDLADNEALLLARWTAKTAYALHASANYRRIVPENHYQVFDTPDYRLPVGVGVVAHTYKSGKDFSWSQTTNWHCLAVDGTSASDMEAIRTSGYKIAVKLGGLFLMIFHNPVAHSRETLVFGKHIPLYPRWPHPVTWMRMPGPWPGREMVRFHAFVQLLGIAFGAHDPDSPFATKDGVSLDGPPLRIDAETGEPL